MPHCNRVNPFGVIFATEHRGDFMGNRGGQLHDADKTIVRRWANRSWITCLLAFNGRKRQIMALDAYTELFFLDEATALAAGHRPCAECRRADYNRFKAAFIDAQGAQGLTIRSAADMDRVLHQERTASSRPRAHAVDLPDAAMVAMDGVAWLKLGDDLWSWTPSGYGTNRTLPDVELDVLTPASTLSVLRAGYVAQVHSSGLPVG